MWTQFVRESSCIVVAQQCRQRHECWTCCEEAGALLQTGKPTDIRQQPTRHPYTAAAGCTAWAASSPGCAGCRPYCMEKTACCRTCTRQPTPGSMPCLVVLQSNQDGKSRACAKNRCRGTRANRHGLRHAAQLPSGTTASRGMRGIIRHVSIPQPAAAAVLLLLISPGGYQQAGRPNTSRAPPGYTPCTQSSQSCRPGHQAHPWTHNTHTGTDTGAAAAAGGGW